MSQQEKNQNQRKQLKDYARYSSIGIQMFAIIAAGSFLGFKLDEKFINEGNIWTISLSLISVIISLTIVIKRIISASKE